MELFAFLNLAKPCNVYICVPQGGHIEQHPSQEFLKPRSRLLALEIFCLSVYYENNFKVLLELSGMALILLYFSYLLYKI